MTFNQGHALLIGVGEYKNISTANVPMAVTDAQAVAEVLKDPGTCGYPLGQVKLLVNEGASKARTLAALDELARSAGEEATVFLFYCGHGAMGEDGNYYFVSQDARVSGNKVKAGTGVSEAEFIDKLRAVRAKRILVALNTCFSGKVSPSLSLEDEALDISTPPQTTTSAILATGSGRIIITAAGENQRSYIGKGQLSFFTQALTDGLRGRGVTSHRGFISAFDLYEYVYDTVSEAVEKQVKVKQEPELTVLKGVGPFAVSLYKGSTSLGEFDTSAPAPELDTVHQVKPEKAEKLMNRIRNNSPDVAITHSPGAIGGNVGGDVEQNYFNVSGGTVNQRRVNTGGGTYVEGDISVNGGDFVGRDKITGPQQDKRFKPSKKK